MTELIAHSTAGSGNDLILLNGGLMSMGGWAEIATPLELDHRVTRCDFRGQLLSPGNPPADVRGHVDDVLQLLDALAIDKVDVVGASFGAIVGALLTSSHPERVRSFVGMTFGDFVDDAMRSGTRLLREASLEAAAGGDRAKVLDLLIPATFSPAYIESHPGRFATQKMALPLLPPSYFEGLATILGALDGLDIRTEVASIAVPSLIIAAGDDQMFPLAEARRMAASMRRARFVVVPDSGHGLVVEKPAEVVSLIRDFLSRPHES